jgi:hypothetical protein
MDMKAPSSNSNCRSSVQVHIERLVLDGLPIDRSQSGLIQRAVESALGGMLESGGLSELSSRAEPYLRADSLRLTPGVSPRVLGQQIGAALYEVLNQSQQPPT